MTTVVKTLARWVIWLRWHTIVHAHMINVFFYLCRDPIFDFIRARDVSTHFLSPRPGQLQPTNSARLAELARQIHRAPRARSAAVRNDCRGRGLPRSP